MFDIPMINIKMIYGQTVRHSTRPSLKIKFSGCQNKSQTKGQGEGQGHSQKNQGQRQSQNKVKLKLRSRSSLNESQNGC